MEMYDILQKNPEIWDQFTRKEEYGSSIRDQYERFPFYSSSERNIFEPRCSKFLIEHGYHAEYPENKPFAICLTHDIDDLYKTIRMKSYEALGKLRTTSFSKCIDLISQMRSKKLPLWNFSDIIAIEDRYDAKSSFFFMVQDLGDQDYTYDIKDCELIIGEVTDGGWEVGLHGGHTAYNDWREMKEKKLRLEKILNKKVVGYRNHYLRFKVPDTWEHLHDAGFSYDTTLGYNDCVGFRNGMCHPFNPFNLNTKSEIDILEIPLTIMDNTLDQYMKLDPRKAWELTTQLIDTVDRYHGVLTLLWHNTSFLGDKLEFYERILKYCAKKNAWMTSGEEIAKWVDHSS
jgi:peptidoglycan/xylan/chitin deacetylase (PgdA/CDA1 family)